MAEGGGDQASPTPNEQDSIFNSNRQKLPIMKLKLQTSKKDSMTLQATARSTAASQMKSKNSSYLLLSRVGQGDANTLAQEYGEMLPKTGVYSLPDFKVISFLRVLTDYHKKLEAEERYLEAKDASRRFRKLTKIELNRKVRQMRNRQALELQKIESIQRNQFIEFTNAWDIYMQDYEAAAYESLRKMREKQDFEIINLR